MTKDTIIIVLWVIGVVCWGLGALRIPGSIDWLDAGLAFFGAGLVVERL